MEKDYTEELLKALLSLAYSKSDAEANAAKWQTIGSFVDLVKILLITGGLVYLFLFHVAPYCDFPTP